MGSATTPLALDYNEIMLNDWEIVGNFMYAKTTYPKLISLVQAGLLDLSSVHLQHFPFEELPAAMTAASWMRGLDSTILLVRSGS